ncbi:G-patch domain containing protein [Coccidioides posadasii C735 delta SOWgp]|uniref:G-patch domain containing protein n=1 Tax=Coccidioides posadasii (strain C735) TaxID=222929 RepID=C5P5J9_COCP7|nr:G-patch domain containing protein [Coccidioides posadasii C735 delta SOWgp]EER27989.1 G-patch domain containing protein [Coccidioides posadasii C735 delta SOWgp]|eukprot:XP_003070134.1 G-patch domain containing protein [Coccidioides posadasii C735 delta SOWgp]
MSFKRSRDVFEEDSLQSSHSPFVFYGTPLPAADRQSRDDGSYVPVWKQEVTDERGRKRLHGAFTGGFSAGYFNTVGSKEGWTPSTYISSRLDRAKDRKQPVQQRPEDFMDEEDLREAEEARKLHTTDEFAGFGSTATDPNRKAGLMDIFRVSGETMGVKLLKRMGWKEGQGVGPKVRRRANLHDGVDDSDQTYLFAPENSPMISFDRKDDYKGIGFQRESRLQYSSRSKREIRSDDEDGGAGTFSGPNLSLGKMAANKKNKFPKRGGFGVGILNDTGSDEEDPYEMGPQLSYNRVLVDDRKSKESRPAIRSSNPLLDKKPVFISKKAAAEKAKPGFRKCYDGRFPIDGFLLGNRMSALSLSTDAIKYAPPEVPADWKSSKLQSVASDVAGYISVAEAAKSSTLDPKSRAAILGEAQLPGKSVFDYITPEGREKLVKITGRTDLPPALGEGPPKGFERSESQKQRDLWNLVPRLDKETAIQALNRGASGWMPYSEDKSKRDRYRAFLEIQAGLTDNFPPKCPGASTDDWLNELNEFARAAEVFKPMSGLMASRFTSSTSSTLSPSNGADPSGPLLRKTEKKPEDPAEAAAKLGMYGPMTRITLQFSPTRLLYKRFNLRYAPSRTDSGSGNDNAKETAEMVKERNLELVSKDTMNELMMESQNNVSSIHLGKLPQDQPLPELIKKPIDPDRNEVLEAERPGDAVFKAIFGSDDEDGDSFD